MNTELERKVIILQQDYIPAKGDCHMICHNIVKAYGPNPTDEEVESEVDLFYNNH